MTFFEGVGTRNRKLDFVMIGACSCGNIPVIKSNLFGREDFLALADVCTDSSLYVLV